MSRKESFRRRNQSFTSTRGAGRAKVRFGATATGPEAIANLSNYWASDHQWVQLPKYVDVKNLPLLIQLPAATTAPPEWRFILLICLLDLMQEPVAGRLSQTLQRDFGKAWQGHPTNISWATLMEKCYMAKWIYMKRGKTVHPDGQRRMQEKEAEL